jgi:thiamine-phosphate pyrophosphorylase
LAATAATLGLRARRGKRGRANPPPSLWFLTDRERTPDPLAAAARLPRGAAVIYRTFGAPEAPALARALRAVTRARGVRLLIAADVRLAAAVGADGVHLPERLMRLAPRLKHAHPRWLITAAAHDAAAIVAGRRLGVDALLVSTVFASASPSARAAMGPVRFAVLTRFAAVPLIALGGVTARTAPRLAGSRAAGLAAVEALA